MLIGLFVNDPFTFLKSTVGLIYKYVHTPLGGVPRSEEASEALTVALNWAAAAAAAAAAAMATFEVDDEAGDDLGSSPLSLRSLDPFGEKLFHGSPCGYSPGGHAVVRPNVGFTLRDWEI